MTAEVPQEFGADALLRLVESNTIIGRSKKVEALEKAFFLAESAQQPVKLRTIPGSLVDTRSGYRAAAYQLNFDRLSLQSRAVRDLLPLDPAKARKLYEQIRFPTLTPLGCEQTLVYDVGSYYETLAVVLNGAYTAKEKAEGSSIALLQSVISDLRSHAQVGPVARTLATVGLSSSQLANLSNLFVSSLQRLQGDERSFAVAATKFDALGALAQLTGALDSANISTPAIVQMIREYVVSNIQGIRCSDTGRIDQGSLPIAAADFNELFRNALLRSTLFPIGLDELQGSKLGPALVFHPFWQTSPARELLVGAKKLRFGVGNTPISLEERTTTGWNIELTDFLSELESWRPTSSEEQEDFFHQKSVLYESLIELIPSGPEQLKVIRSFVTFLELNSFAATNRIEWFLHVEDLLARLRTEKAVNGEHAVLDAFRDSRDAVLNLYGQVEILAPLSSR